ncbi:efflux RND transporter periplasmic adaptor subunit [Chloroflexota bacterium]
MGSNSVDIVKVDRALRKGGMMKKRKLPRVMLIVAITGGLTILLSSCTPESEATATEEYPVIAVQRGDITIDIAAAGNLSYSLQEDLAFEMAGTVEEVLVEVGDSVEEGQVMARLDSSEWEDQLTVAENSLLQAEINVRNAEIALDNAKNPYTEEEIEEAEDELRMAENQLRYDLKHGPESSVLQSQESVYQKQKTLDEMEEAADEDDIEIKEMQLRLAEAQLENAMDEVEEALDANLEIIAPFDGFITWVNTEAEGGDEVMKGTVAVQIADPTRFEAVLWVSETDIFDVKLGGEASVQVDAISTLNLPAEVTDISPTAIIQSGVVNYEVTVEAESLEIVRQRQLEAMQEHQKTVQEMTTSGEIPEQLQEAIEAGEITQEQAEEMISNWQQRGEGSSLEQMPTLIPEDFKLKEGLSVTVSIVISQASDVLLVPNPAVTYLRGEAYVQVLLPDGEIEERLIQTGISDWQYTEVSEGLSEGEEVILPDAASAGTATTPEQEDQRPSGGIMPPMRGGGPHP